MFTAFSVFLSHTVEWRLNSKWLPMITQRKRIENCEIIPSSSVLPTCHSSFSVFLHFPVKPDSQTPITKENWNYLPKQYFISTALFPPLLNRNVCQIFPSTRGDNKKDLCLLLAKNKFLRAFKTVPPPLSLPPLPCFQENISADCRGQFEESWASLGKVNWDLSKQLLRPSCRRSVSCDF